MTTYRLWPSTPGPTVTQNDDQPYTLGVEFYVTADANATAVHFWRPGTSQPITMDVGIYQVNSSSSGALLGSVLGISSPANQGAWHRVQLTSPVPLIANQRYRAVVKSTDTNIYGATGAYWTSGPGSSGVTNGILVAPNWNDAVGNAQGSFANLNNLGSTQLNFPTNYFNAGNYWIDPEVETIESGPQWQRFNGSDWVNQNVTVI